MPDTPLVFSTVTGLTLAFSGGLLGMGGFPGWGLAVVGAGILALSLGGWLQQAAKARPATLQPIAQDAVFLYGGERG